MVVSLGCWRVQRLSHERRDPEFKLGPPYSSSDKGWIDRTALLGFTYSHTIQIFEVRSSHGGCLQETFALSFVCNHAVAIRTIPCPFPTRCWRNLPMHHQHQQTTFMDYSIHLVCEALSALPTLIAQLHCRHSDPTRLCAESSSAGRPTPVDSKYPGRVHSVDWLHLSAFGSVGCPSPILKRVRSLFVV